MFLPKQLCEFVYIVVSIVTPSQSPANKGRGGGMEERNNNKKKGKYLLHIILSNCSNFISEW